MPQTNKLQPATSPNTANQGPQHMKEIIIYSIAGLASLFIFGYSIHMFVGGLVSRETEILLIAGGCIVAAIAMGLMAMDIVRRRRQNQ